MGTTGEIGQCGERGDKGHKGEHEQGPPAVINRLTITEVECNAVLSPC